MIQIKLIRDTDKVEDIEVEVNKFLKTIDSKNIINIQYVPSSEGQNVYYWPRCMIVYEDEH